MTDRLAQLEAETARLREELAAMRTQAEDNDSFANGTRAVLLHLLSALHKHQPAVLDEMQDWMQEQRVQYDRYLLTGDRNLLDAPSPSWTESVAKLAPFLWDAPRKQGSGSR